MKRSSAEILEAIIGGALLVDREGRVEDLNSEALRLLEVSTDRILGALLREVVGEDHEVVRVVAAVLAGSPAAIASDVALRRRVGGDLTVELAVSATGPRADPNGCLVILRDLTAQKTLLQQRSEGERHASFGKIAAGLAHEIKNPLSGIRGAGELIVARNSGGKSAELAEMIVSEAQRIARLVDQFMVFTAGDGLGWGWVNIHQVLDHVLRTLENDPVAARVEIARAYDPSIPEFLADGDRLTQIFLNILRNAYQALSDRTDARVTVRTRVRMDHRIGKAGESAAPNLAVSVIDNGPGFPVEILPEATTPFVTGKSEGTGLGLAISEYWTHRHDGTIAIENQRDGGARVTVSLPLRRKEPKR